MTGKEENRTGRPTKYTEEIVQKLEVGFSRGYSIAEACSYAGIVKATYFNWVEEYEGFLDRMDIARNSLNMKAKNNIYDEIEKGNIEISKWHLERRAKDEYSTKQNVEAEVNTDVNIVVELVDE